MARYISYTRYRRLPLVLRPTLDWMPQLHPRPALHSYTRNAVMWALADELYNQLIVPGEGIRLAARRQRAVT